jgi:hypothetical protein
MRLYLSARTMAPRHSQHRADHFRKGQRPVPIFRPRQSPPRLLPDAPCLLRGPAAQAHSDASHALQCDEGLEQDADDANAPPISATPLRATATREGRVCCFRSLPEVPAGSLKRLLSSRGYAMRSVTLGIAVAATLTLIPVPASAQPIYVPGTGDGMARGGIRRDCARCWRVHSVPPH